MIIQNLGQNKNVVCSKNRTCHYLDDIIKIEDFDFDNILLDRKSYKNILIHSFIQNFDW